MNLREKVEGEMKWTADCFKDRTPPYNDYDKVLEMEGDESDNSFFDAGLISAYKNVLRWIDEK